MGKLRTKAVRNATAVCVDHAKQNRKAVHMNIIMCRASYSG